MIKAPKKLIEVALPLDDINTASAREKSIRHGHPSTLHLWWARRPLAAARAVLFAQLVNDPGGDRGWGRYPGQTKEDAQQERERLFALIRELVKWENTTNEVVLEQAREEIRKSWRETCELNKGQPGFDPDKLPAFHDPFAGGGSIPLEAQRLGLEAHASDLNPVAVLINKAMIEIPPKFAGHPPVNPESRKDNRLMERPWRGAQGLAEDVRYYGKWMRDEAEKRIGHLYPKVEITQEMVQKRPDLKQYQGRKLTVIAWIWARTVKSPNPAYSHIDVPLASTFMLSTKAGKEAYVEPVIENDGYRFTVKVGKPRDVDKAKNGTKLSRANFVCLLSGTPIPGDYIKGEGKAGRIGVRLMSIVTEGDRERVYIEPTIEQEKVAQRIKPTWHPQGEIAKRMTGGNCTPYGLTTWCDLFTPRQLLALTTLSDLVGESIKYIRSDALEAGIIDDGKPLRFGGVSAKAYAEAIGLYLAFSVDRMAMTGNSLVRWNPVGQKAQHCFGRQGLPMLWDFSEPNFLGTATGSIDAAIFYSYDPLNWLFQTVIGKSEQNDATTQTISEAKCVSTDPPYYDNIGYADLSDFFYVWLRNSIREVFPELFATYATPKSDELVATPYRHGSKEKADLFFLDGMSKAIRRIAIQANPSFPVTIYYAFKQTESDAGFGTTSTGWETFLDAVILSGFMVCGTWPMRTEMRTRQIAMASNALASSIVLVCRKRDLSAPSISRRQFLRELKDELPEALETMIGGKKGASPIAPVDLAQAAIGPGMGVYSRYAGVLEADGGKMSVRDALIQINKVIDEYFNEVEGDMDSDTRFCIDWFMQYGFKDAEFGQADVLARAKGTTVDGLVLAGVVESRAGRVRLLKFEEYKPDWNPETDIRTPTWEALHQLIRALRTGGEVDAGILLGKMPERTESIRQLAYRLYTLCERKGWAEEARAYNELIASWYGTVEAADQAQAKSRRLEQRSFAL